MATKIAFSTSDDVIANTDCIVQESINDPYDYFEIQRCKDFVINNNYKNVVLQFPDELMNYAKYVCECIEETAGNTRAYILADTSYGSCCVDEVAASHVNADSIIHFGQSCLSSTENLPVLYIFGRSEFSEVNFIDRLYEMFPDKDSRILLFYDVTYTRYIEQLSDRLSLSYPNLLVTRINYPKHVDKTNNSDELNSTNTSENQSIEVHEELIETKVTDEIESYCFGRCYSCRDDISTYDILFIGPETLTLRNLIYRFNRNKVLSYNPYKNEIRLESTNVNKSLMKRYYLIEKAKDAMIVGIIMGTLGVARYKEMVSRLKAVLKHAGKKFYTFIIGKINVAKMANFMEIDIFVLVACPENTLIDSKEFYKPIVTPYEIEIACLQTRDWTGDYITEFSRMLPGEASHVEIDDGSVSTEPEYSLITGKMRSNLRLSESETVTCMDLSLRSKENAILPYTAGEYLSSRSWTGLEVNYGKTEVKEAEEGRSGIAMGYQNECHSDKCCHGN